MSSKSEEVVLRLRDENINLKKQLTEYQDALKRTTTKMGMVEEAMRRAGDSTAATSLISAQQRIVELEEENESLRRKQRILGDKLRIAEETLRVKSKLNGSSLPPGRVPRPSSARASPGLGGGPGSVRGKSRSPSPSARPSTVSRIGTVSTPRDTTPRGELAESKAPGAATVGRDAEIDRLQGQLAALSANVAALTSENAALRTKLQQPDASKPFVATQPGSVSIAERDLMELERQLRDRSAQVLLLKSRFEHLEAKGSAERELYDRAVMTLEGQNMELRDLRARLQASEVDLNMLRARLSHNAEMEMELRKARDEVHRLEVMLTDLAESPFIRGDGGAGGSLLRDAMSQRQKLEQLEITEKALRDQVAHLQQALKGNQLELSSARKEKDSLREDVERMRDEQDRLKAAAEASARANTVMRERLALYAGGAALEGVAAIPGDALSVPVEELERALALVRRKMDRPTKLDGDLAVLSNATYDDSLASATPATLRQRVQQLQLALLESQAELERSEKMLKAQSSISGDLSAEVTELHSRLGNETTALKRKLMELESTAEQRLQRIHLLEAQVAQLLTQAKAAAGRKQRQKRDAAMTETKPRREPRPVDDDASTVISEVSDSEAHDTQPHQPRFDDMEDETLLSESMTSDVFDFAPGENRLEVYVVDAMLDPSVLSRSASTFALIDFLNFESQQTPLGFGPAPVYNSSSLFSFMMDPFVLRYFATESVTIDVHQAKGADFEMVGRVSIPLHTLLGGQRKVRHADLPIRATNGKVVGSIQVELRVSIGLGEAWQAFCRDNPTDGAELTASMSGTGALSRVEQPGKTQPNDLVVSVISASGLKSRAAATGSGVSILTAPSAYVQYTLPLASTKTAFTSIVRNKSDPVFADSRRFPLNPTMSTLATLTSSPLRFVVCDDDAAVQSDHPLAAPSAPSSSRSTTVPPHRAVLGVVTVGLAAIAEGLETEGEYEIVSEKGASVGRLKIRIMWSRPLITTDGAPPDTITKAQFHALCGLFDRDGYGVKYAALNSVVTASENDYKSIDRVRRAIAAHNRDQNISDTLRSSQSVYRMNTGAAGQSSRARTWVEALHGMAEVAGRSGKRVLPREVYDALTGGSSGSRVVIDLASVEDAVMCLMGPSESSVPVEDVIDVLTPIGAAAEIACAKVRKFMSSISLKNGPMHFLNALNNAAKSSELAGNAMPGRLSRSAVAAVLKDIGLLIIEDSMPRAFAEFGRATETAPARDTREEELLPSSHFPSRQQATYSSWMNRSTVVPSGTQSIAVGQSLLATQPKVNASEFAFDLLSAADRLTINRGFAHQSAAAPVYAPEPAPTAVESLVVTTPAPAPAPAAIPEAAEPSSVPASTTKKKRAPKRKSHAEDAPSPGIVYAAPFSWHSIANPSTAAYPTSMVIDLPSINRIKPALSRLLGAHATAVSRGAGNTLPMHGMEPAVYVTYRMPWQDIYLAEVPGLGRKEHVAPQQIVLYAPLSARRLNPRSLAFAPFRADGKHDVCTGFPLVASAGQAQQQKESAMALGHFIKSALDDEAIPEEADISFELSLLPPPPHVPSQIAYDNAILARATFSLRDILTDGADVDAASLPVYAANNFNALFTRYENDMRQAGKDDNDAVSVETMAESLRRQSAVADLTASITVYTALKALLGGK